MKAIESIDAITSFKDALAECEISQSLSISLRNLSSTLKEKGVPLSHLVQLYTFLDPSFIGKIQLPEILV